VIVPPPAPLLAENIAAAPVPALLFFTLTTADAFALCEISSTFDGVMPMPRFPLNCALLPVGVIAA
jgi:hypothetical protein